MMTNWLKVAVANGLSRQCYYDRVKRGMSPEMAATAPKKTPGKRVVGYQEFVVYKGDEFICMGTDEECANFMNIKMSTFRFYLTPAHARRVAKRKTQRRGYITVTLLEDEEDETN